MPYELEKVPMGYYVRRKQLGDTARFSKKPLSREMAIKQMRALYRSERESKK